MSEIAFREAYETLNTAQKKAVDTIEGPVMVIAGPGTGKTQILTLRIANILKETDTAPESILALTFTESGARAMRERLRGYVGTRAYGVPIYTFHAFADMLIRRYPEYYTRVVGGRAIGDIERIECIETILSGDAFQYIRPVGNPQFYTKAIIQSIADMKREYISPDRFAELIADEEAILADMPQYHEKGAHKGKERNDYKQKVREIAKNKELLFVYRAYEHELITRQLYDFEDMIVETVRALEEHEDLLRELQETYQYILADEHQDVNGSQNRILECLASYHEQPNLFVVGDEKQAIYRFQGASLDNFLYFESRFPGTTTISLTENYRSGQTVLDAAHSLITSQSGPADELRVPLTAAAVEVSRVDEYHFSHEGIENAWLADNIASIDGPREEIAVIVRTNREVEQIAGLLRKHGIPVRASTESDILHHPIMHEIRALLSVVAEPSDAALFRVLHGAYWGISADDLVRIAMMRRGDRTLTRSIRDEKLLREQKLHDPDAVRTVGTVLDRVHAKSTTEPPHRLLEELLHESGFLAHVLQENALEGVRVVRRIYDEIERMVISGEAATLRDVVRIFDTRIAYDLPMNAPFVDEDHDAVSVMTAHKSKGLEFTHVFIPHLTDRSWGGRRKTQHFKIPMPHMVNMDAVDDLDDERRLFYVAVTRAKHAVYLSYADTNSDGKGFLPSRLREEIDDTYVTSETTTSIEQSFDPAQAMNGNADTPTITPELIKTAFLERGLSATALNNYIDSPWLYFYRNVLRVPEIQQPHLQYGTAIHAVMQQASQYVRTNKTTPSISEVSTWLDRELRKLPLSEQECATLHEKGLAALTIYLESTSFAPNAREELQVSVILETGDPDVPEVPLTGMLDRIDCNESGQALRVVDYKTGKPKTRGQIEGTTKDSNGGYKRQLVFYALLLSLYDDPRYTCREGVLSFIEPDAKGGIREEVFTVTDAEIAELKDEIIRIAKEIVNGSFLTTPCDPDVCEYCDLAQLTFKAPTVPE